MQYGQDVKIKMWTPRILLHNVKETFKAWIGTLGAQLTLNGVPFSNVKTVKFIIGGVGVTGCDFNFTSAANQTRQDFDLGSIIPAMARVLDIKTLTDAVFTGAISLVAVIGNAAGGAQFNTSTTIYAKDAVTCIPNTLIHNVAPAVAASKVFLGITPGANWSLVTAGKVTIWITYIEV